MDFGKKAFYSLAGASFLTCIVAFVAILNR